MGVECASCGQVIPSGQLRCGNCGAAQSSEGFDDYGSLTEVPSEPSEAPLESASTNPSGSSSMGSAAVVASTLPASVPSGAIIPSLRTPIPARPMAGADEDEAAAREPAVPRGTFASEVPDRGMLGDEREPPRSEPPSSRANNNHRPAAVAPTRPISVRPTAPPRPPYLASEILREDLAPSEPGWRLMSLVVQLAPALGALAVLTSGLKRVATYVAITAFIGLFGMARLELTYNMRALLVALIGGSMLSLVTVWRTALGGGVDGPLLALVITLLPAALLFRAWFRAAYTARVLVSIALVLAATWATATSNRELLSLEFEWQSWLPALAWYLFCLLCLLALLAFMGDETTGGCDAWALGLLVWYGLFACVRFALETSHGVMLSGNLQTLGLAEPALAAPTAVAMAQLFARLLCARHPRSPTPGAPTPTL